MEYFVIIFVFLGVCGIGFIKIFFKQKKLKERFNFANEFLKKLTRYVVSVGQKKDDYDWMTYRSHRMQRHLGNLGIASYKPYFPGIPYSSILELIC